MMTALVLLLCLASAPSSSPSPSPSSPSSPPETVTAGPGDTLEQIAARAYGSRHYAALVARVNRLARPEALRAGQAVSVPPIARLAAPLSARIPEGNAALLRALASWRAHVDAVQAAQRKSGRAFSLELAGAAADAALAEHACRAAGAPSLQLRTLAASLAAMAQGEGAADPEGYAIDDVDRRFALALGALLDWDAAFAHAHAPAPAPAATR